MTHLLMAADAKCCSNRMDSGRFESVLKPYKFHQVMRSLFVPLRLATDARKLQFITDLDMSIDDVARRALYEATGESEDVIKARLKAAEDGIVVGDETRLRQVITNLARCVDARLVLSGQEESQLTRPSYSTATRASSLRRAGS